MTKWYIDKITFSISMLFLSSVLCSTCLAFVIFREIALRHEENTLFLTVISVIAYLACLVTLIIGLHTLDEIKEKIISKGNDKEY